MNLDRKDAQIQLNGVYKHYKGKEYRLLQIVKHSETLEDLVYYECLYENDLGRFWVRPFEMFFSEVTIEGKRVPRFALQPEL